MKAFLNASLSIQVTVLAIAILIGSSICWFGICELTMPWLDFSDRLVLLSLIVLVSATTAGILLLVVRQKVFVPLRIIERYNLKQASECTADDCFVMLIPGDRIPSGEIGNLMRSRNAMLEHLARTLHQLQENYQKIRRLEKLKDDLSQMIVHDLKNPLGVVLLSLDVLQKKELSQEQQNLIQQVRQSCKQMLSMILNLLDISKMEEGKLQLKKSAVNLSELVSNVVQEVRESGIAGNRALTVDTPMRPVFLGVDVDLFSRVITNLLSNAIKYTLTTGRIEVRVSQGDDNTTVLSVKDDGAGIPQEYHQRIFEKFEQVENKQNNQRIGTGIGLTFCKLAVEAHGGRIWVESEPGRGSMFFLEIPGVPSPKISSESALSEIAD